MGLYRDDGEQNGSCYIIMGEREKTYVEQEGERERERERERGVYKYILILYFLGGWTM